MPCPPAVKVRTVATSVTQASPWQKGPMQLALTLRKENETLRGLLVTAAAQVAARLEFRRAFVSVAKRKLS